MSSCSISEAKTCRDVYKLTVSYEIQSSFFAVKSATQYVPSSPKTSHPLGNARQIRQEAKANLAERATTGRSPTIVDIGDTEPLDAIEDAC